MTGPKFYQSRRSVVLALVGLMFILFGYGICSSPDTDTSVLRYAMPLKVAPMSVWGSLFAACGLLSIACAVLKRHGLGYAVVMGASVCWSFMFVSSWLITGYDRSIVSFSQWATVTVLLAVISGWPDPPCKNIRAHMESP